MDEKKENSKTVEFGGKNTGYLLNIKEDGVYFIVYPYVDEQIHFELSDITMLLDEQEIKDYDAELIAQTIREGNGEEVKIAETNCLKEEKDPKIEISISKNRMEASLRIEMDENSKSPTEEMIREKINQAKIVFGIQEEEIKKLAQLSTCDAVIASGIPPQNGEDAKLIKYFDLDKCGRPEEVEHGKVDFKNLNLFVIVKKGDLLAERIPQTAGTPGMDVLGGIVAAKPGKPLRLPVGKNTKLIDDNKIVSELDGQIVLVNNKIMVDPRLEIKGDVDVSTGNIEFTGSVFIKGSVQAGFAVKATGDVEIMGTVSGGSVEARNITIKAGIQGMQRGKIVAQEDIRTSFAENAKIIAGRDLYISEAILHSSVSAGKRIIVDGRRGVIAGGAAVAGSEIRVKSAGSQMDTSTKLEVGINPMLREELQKTKKMLSEAQEALDQAQKAVKVLKGIPKENLSPSRQEILLKLTKAQFPLAGEVKKHKDRLNEIENEVISLKDGKVKVADVVYPGVKIIVGSFIKNIRSKEQHCTFYAEDGEIKTGLY